MLCVCDLKRWMVCPASITSWRLETKVDLGFCEYPSMEHLVRLFWCPITYAMKAVFCGTMGWGEKREIRAINRCSYGREGKRKW